MNKDKRIYNPLSKWLYAFFVTLILVTAACKKNPKEDITPLANNSTVNEWVVEQMRIYYYWNYGVPANTNLNFNQEPKAFFETIRNKDDRFSWIEKAVELKQGLSGVSTSTGINFGLVGGQNNVVFGYIRYVIPNSPADLAGVKRGMFFTKVNGLSMNQSNYNEVLKPYYNGEKLKLQLAQLQVGGSIIETNEVDLQSIKVSEPAVYTHKILTTNSGRKVGYLFYNRFLNEKSNELFTAFEHFKAEGVQDLILDIRYNLGGGIGVSGILSALIMPNYDKNKIFVEYNYNEDLNKAFDAAYASDPIKNKSRKNKFIDLYNDVSRKPTKTTADSVHNLVQSANINLERVYVLATKNSASASELVINNLKPYMEVIHIGEKTRGKNEGSITLDDEKNHDWAIQPIILKLANAEHFGDYAQGLVPSFAVEEGYDLKPHGSVEDPLIKLALGRIDPSMLARGRGIPPRVSATLNEIKMFDEKNNKAYPVLVDRTIDKNKINRMVK